MMTDDEKYLFGEKRTIEEVQGYTANNVKGNLLSPHHHAPLFSYRSLIRRSF